MQMSRKQLESRVTHLEGEIERAGEVISQSQAICMTQDIEISRLTQLNDRMFAIIDKLITGPYNAQSQSAPK